VVVDYRGDRVACCYLDYTSYPLGNTGIAHFHGGRRILTCLNDGSLRQWDLDIMHECARTDEMQGRMMTHEGSSCWPFLEVIFKNDFPLFSAYPIMPSYFR